MDVDFLMSVMTTFTTSLQKPAWHSYLIAPKNEGIATLDPWKLPYMGLHQQVP